MKVLSGLSVIIMILAINVGHSRGATHAFGWEDMFSMIRLAEPKPSPDGKWVLFSQAKYNLDSNKSNIDLGMVAIDGKETIKLTSNAAVDTNGRWLPDGSAILFLSSRSGSVQIWKLPLKAGEAVQVTNLPTDIDGFEISPDGKKILFWTSVFIDCKDLACTAERLKKQESNPVKAKIFDSLFIRHWDTWNDGRRNHLFVMDLHDQKPKDLMRGMDQDSPTKPWGGSDEVSWSPDSSTIAFASKPSKGEAWHTNTEIYMVDANGRKKPRCVTTENPAWDSGPVFSPDGKTLAYIAMQRPGYESDRFQVVLMDVKTQKKQKLTANWDRSVRSLVWAADGSVIYLNAAEKGRVRIFSVDTASGKVRSLVTEGSNKYLTITRLGILVFLRDRMTHPKEVFTYNPGTQNISQISQINSPRLSTVRMSEPEEFWYTHDGFQIQGWLLKPVDYRKGRKYPLAFLVHGGPQGFWGDSFHYRWNPQFYAGAGYVVVGINFRGSTSYGQEFTDAIRGNWGPGPYSDLMAGLEFVLKNHGYIDSKKMCALGASFGGYMVNWIAGQDHPFKCLVNHDGDFDTTSSYFNTEELWFPEWEMTGPPWEKREVFERNSPMYNVAKWKTPMLVIQGALDFRVVETEAFATFNALQRLGIESRLLYFPDENHWVKKALNSKLWHESVLEWLDRWTRTKRRR
jgi:dipeptidyl aminopeptidase/acylaminoacyl peptidase